MIRVGIWYTPNMNNLEPAFLIIFSFYSLACFYSGYKNAIQQKNAFGYSTAFIPLGSWVWGDALIFGLFWFLVSVFILFKNDWILFLLIISVFWMVRSFAEIIYWLNQQFSVKERNHPKNLKFNQFFHNDSIWFIYQIVWQCILVVSLITTVYLFKLWLIF